MSRILTSPYRSDPYRAGYLAALEDVLANCDIDPVPTGFKITMNRDWLMGQLERIRKAQKEANERP